MVEAGIIGSLSCIATSGAAAPIRSTTTLIDDNGTCARASACMTDGGSGPLGTGADLTARDCGAGCFGVRACAAGDAAPRAITSVTVLATNRALRQPDVRVAGV